MACRWTSMALILAGAVSGSAQEPRGTMRVPALRSGFPLTDCRIVHPASDAGHAEARRLAQAVDAANGRAILLPVAEALDKSRLRAEIASAPHILLGNINNNRALLAYYADLADFSDAYHPGGDGYVVRVVPSGSGRGGDALIVGASSDLGLKRGVDRLAQLLEAADGPALPYVFEAEVQGEVAQAVPLSRWSAPYDPNRWANTSYVDMARAAAYAYALTAHQPAAEVAVEGLLKGAREHGWYPVSDYTLEWLTRAWSYVRDAPCVSEEDAEIIDSAFLRTLYEDEKQYWRARNGSRIGSRHQTMGTSAFYTGVRLLLRRGNPDDAAREQLETWRSECEEYFANATQTFHDDFEGIPTYHSFQPIANEALRTGVTEYFGENLDWAVRRALAVTDNLGFYAGTGTYEEARPGTTRSSIMLGYPLAMAALLRDDPGYEWLLRNFPGTGRGTWGLVVGFGARGFTRPSDCPAEVPRELLGVVTVPLGPYREARLPQPAQGLPFEKLCLRDSFDAGGQFLVLQGFQGLGADNIPPRDANSIIRYTDLGHIWLYANSERSGNFYRNAVYVSDGLNATWGAPVCELLANTDAGPVAIVASRLRDYVAADWTRIIVWRKGYYHVVIDQLEQTRAGEHAATCTFRTPCAAERTPTGMRAWEGDAEMFVANVDGLVHTVGRSPTREGAAVPTFMRQRQPLSGEVGGTTVFRNVIYATDPQRVVALEARPVGQWALMVRGETPEGRQIALMGVCPEGEKLSVGSFETGAPLFFVSPDAVVAPPGTVLDGLALDQNAGAEQLRSALNRLWEDLPEADGAQEVGVPKREAERVLRFSGFTARAEPILGPDISTQPSPTRGLSLDLVDGTIPLWQAVSFPAYSDVRITFDLRQTERLDSIELATGLVKGTNIVPDPETLPAPRPATVNLDGAAREVEFACGSTYEPLHKGVVCAMGRWRCELNGAQARRLELVLPKGAWPGGGGLREIVIRRHGTNDAAPVFVRQADMDADGQSELILASDTGEIVCLSADGRELWRLTLPGPITALECVNLGEAAPALLAATREARLYRVTPAGEIAWTVDFIRMANENGDLPTAYSIGTWTNRDGVREIVCGNYNACSFVSVDGTEADFCRAGGAFETMMLPRAIDLTGDGIEDQLLFNVWRSASIIDGAQRKTIGGRSVPGGEGLCFEWWSDDPDRPLLLVAAENGVGLLNAKTGEYRWRQDISPLSGCGIGDFGGDLGRVVVLTKRDGFVLAYSEEGELLRRTMVGELLECATIVNTTDGTDRLVAAGDSRIVLFDRDLRDCVEIAEGSATRLVSLEEPGLFAALRPRETVDILRITDIRR